MPRTLVEERLLQDEVLRTFHSAGRRIALLLRLSHLRPPAPAPHHRRVARILLADAAAGAGGRVFGLANGDLALVMDLRAPAELDRLVAMMMRLFIADAGDPRRLLSVWRLDRPADDLLEELARRLSAVDLGRSPTEVARSDPGADSTAIGRLIARAGAADAASLLRRETVARLDPADPALIRPWARAVAFSVPTIAAAAWSGAAADTMGDLSGTHAGGGEKTTDSPTEDPALARHLLRRLDAILLGLLGRGALTPDGTGGLPLLLPLAVPTVLSPGFAQLVEVEEGRAAPMIATAPVITPAVMVAIDIADAAIDAAAFARARARIMAAGFGLMIDGVGELTLPMLRADAFAADMVALDWTPGLDQRSRAVQGAIDDAVARLRPSRVLLRGVGGERALAWGHRRGIRHFQGRQVEAMFSAMSNAWPGWAGRSAAGPTGRAATASTTAAAPAADPVLAPAPPATSVAASVPTLASAPGLAEAALRARTAIAGGMIAGAAMAGAA